MLMIPFTRSSSSSSIGLVSNIGRGFPARRLLKSKMMFHRKTFPTLLLLSTYSSSTAATFASSASSTTAVSTTSRYSSSLAFQHARQHQRQRQEKENPHYTTRTTTRTTSSSSSSSIWFSSQDDHYGRKNHHQHRHPLFYHQTESRRNISFFSSFSSLSFSSNNNHHHDAFPPPLTSIHDLAQRLSNNEYQNIVVLVGAGASVNAGIPDFRTPGSGLYDQLQEYNLPYPEAIFDLEYFQNHNPYPFLHLCHSIWPGQVGGPKPTWTHSFLKVLQDSENNNNNSCLRRIYTQNIDGLESLAGIQDDKLVECHGHFRSTSCITCRTKMDVEDYKSIIFGTNRNDDSKEYKSPSSSSSSSSSHNNHNHKEKNVPTCSECGSLVKPDIVFFGEELPARFQRLVHQDARECDLLLIIGTSLQVMPVAAIPSWVHQDCSRVLVNRDLVGDFATATSSNTKRKNNKIGNGDIVLQGDCDDSIHELCRLAGWQDRLQAVHHANN